MDKKAYRDRLRSQDKRERTAASLGLPYSGRDLAIAFGLYLAAVLLCLLFSPLVSLRQLFGIEGFSLIEILGGENAQQSAIIMGVIAIVLAAASQLAVKRADMLARSREGSAE